MNNEFDPYYTAMGWSEEGFPIRPRTPADRGRLELLSSDPIYNHKRWSGEFKGYPIELPTGTTSGILALRMFKTPDHSQSGDITTLLRLENEHGQLPRTLSYDDACSTTKLYECPDDLSINGEVAISPGLSIFGNGTSIVLPPYICPTTGRIIRFLQESNFIRDSIVLAPGWLMMTLPNAASISSGMAFAA